MKENTKERDKPQGKQVGCPSALAGQENLRSL